MILAETFEEMLKEIERSAPLIHHITNYVTANDSANTVLALGGSPVMAEDESEVEEMVSIASALVLNIGILSQQKANALLKAGRKANILGIPVILDPVGLGTTQLRRSFVNRLLNEVDLSVIRGNMSEILHLYGGAAVTRGVDSIEGTENGGEDLARNLAKRYQCTIAITGEVDIISDGDRTYHIHNGHPLLSKVTGTGCMSASIIGLCCAAGKPSLYGALLGLSIMGIAGEIAEARLDRPKGDGLGTFKVHLFDAFSLFTVQDYKERGKIHEIHES